jgi:Ser/Thr protein kinase RdoA (MazF antagonist)
MTASELDEIRGRVLAHYPDWQGATTTRIGGGLINRSYLLTRAGAAPARAVLQAVSAIFPPAIHDNIAAVTARLAERGLATPRLLPTRDGRLFIAADDQGGMWRLLTYVEGTSFDVVADAAQARAAGELVGRFHRALDDFDHPFAAGRTGVHDTPAHLGRLADALAAHPNHRLAPAVASLAASIQLGAAALRPLPAIPPRVCHGDLKFNNIMFAGAHPPASAQAVCLIDLDTVGPLSLAYELGDAWRSWCNRAGEDDEHARLDLDIFTASLAGYQAGLGRPLAAGEREALLSGVEWVSLELTARFAADALAESYFGWDRSRFPGRGEHNLLRARGQWSLHRALLASRPERARLLNA